MNRNTHQKERTSASGTIGSGQLNLDRRVFIVTAPTRIDFQEVREQISLHQAIQYLGLTMRQERGAFRGPCIACKGGGDRALVVTPGKGFFCFSANKGGNDSTALVAHVKAIPQRDAAALLIEHYGISHSGQSRTVPPTPTSSPKKAATGFDAEAYLKGLDPAAPQLSELGVAADTLKEWKAGYSKAGVNKGKLAIALCDRDGTIIGFCGRSLDGSSPLLSFPNGVDPQTVIFGADKVQSGNLVLARDPLAVMAATENGVENCIALLTESIGVTQLEVLIALMHEKDIESVELF
jgi:hypothetical protein